MKNILVIISLILLWSSAPSEIKMQDKERYCIAEAIKISKQYSNSIWKDFNKTPFTLLLVTKDYEFLINHPSPSKDFKFLKYDDLLESKIFYRDTQFNTSFLATFPAVNGVNCIVVGTPENTNRNSTEWIITLLHEHFHKYVYDSKNYYDAVNDLDLANGDNTGMWMLNYPFPYEDKKVALLYNAYITSLKNLTAIENLTSEIFKDSYKTYLNNRQKFKSSISASDYRYFSFQLWQEGIARYTEMKLLKAMTNYEPSLTISGLADYIDFNVYAEQMLKKEMGKLQTFKLAEQKRVCFYSVGLAEGLVLDKLNPKWGANYLINKFYLEKYQ